MVTPYALQVQPLDVGKAIGLYQQGEQDRVAQDQRTAQQDLAKDLPTAIGGDPDAQTRVVSAATRVHPELGMKLLDYMKNAPAEAIARKQKEMDAIGAATEGLPDNPTPQQWADFKARAGQLGIPSADLENLQPEHLGMLRSLSTTWRSARAADEAAALSVAQLKGVEAKTSVDTAMANLWNQNGGTVTPFGPVPNAPPTLVPPPRGAPNATPVTVAPIAPPPSDANGIVQEAGDPRGPVGTKLPATPTPAPAAPATGALPPTQAPGKPPGGVDWSKVRADPDPTVRRIAERIHGGNDEAWAELGAPSLRNPNTPLRNRVSAEVNRLFGLDGLSGDDQNTRAASLKADKASLVQLQRYADNVNTFEDSARRAWGNVKELIRQNPGALADYSPYINQWVQTGRIGALGDEEVPPLAFAMMTALAETAKVTSGSLNGPLTDSARSEVAHYGASIFHNPGQALGIIDRGVIPDMDARKLSFIDGLNTVKARMRGGPEPKPAAAPPIPRADEVQGIPGRPPVVRTKEQFDALPAHSVYVGADGKQYRKP